MAGLLRIAALAAVLLAATGGGAISVGQSVDVGGRMYVDYFYNVAGPDSAASPGAEEGLHGFRYRRLYLTTDFTLSEDFTGRARLEADEGTNGRPIVKDLSLTWAYAGAHSATMGITPPPALGLVEDVWGYRSLEKTLLNVQGVVSSRDFGLRLDGPITSNGTVQYAVMLANNGTVRPETNKYKRIYGQVHIQPSERLRIVVGADHAGYNSNREAGTRVSVFGGYSTDRVRVGLEGYWYRVAMDVGDPRFDIGASLFGGVQVASNWELIARVDRGREAPAGPDRYDALFLGAVSYQPHPNVRLIPNLRLYDRSDAPVETVGRMTVEANF